MENLEFSGKTVEEALQNALEELGVDREEVEVVVVKEGKAGILGLGAESAVIRVVRRAPGLPDAVTDTARSILEKLLALMEIDGTVTVETELLAGQTASTVLNIAGDDLGILIGRRGQTLSSLQYLVRLMVNHQTKSKAPAPIIIDVEGYRRRRYEALEEFARQMAEQVRIKGRPFTFEPMSPFERRIIHVALANNPEVTTESTGEGESRQVVIRLK
ncbi:MAG: protein jag [Chloroflexi bacterium]|nr:protein jag [Chloroflexota bacterium]